MNPFSSPTVYFRATISDPFGTADITNVDFTVDEGAVLTPNLVNTVDCTKTYEYTYNASNTSKTYDIKVTANEGFENTVSVTQNKNLEVCINCPPSAIDDEVKIAQGQSKSIKV